MNLIGVSLLDFCASHTMSERKVIRVYYKREGAWRRLAGLSCPKEPAEVVQPSDQDAWTLPFGGFPGMSNFKKALG